MLNKYALTQALAHLGQAQLAIGDPFTSGGMAMLGMTQGEIGADITYREYDLVAEDYTAGVPHQTSVQVEQAVLTVPLVITNEALLAEVSPTGSASGGTSSPVAVTETSALLIPESEIGAGLSYDGMAWSPAAPKMAIWFWRCYLSRGRLPFRIGTNLVTEVRVRAMLYTAAPEGHKVFTVGNPVTAGIANVRI